MIWFHTLNRPFLAPPDWIFTPAWIFLYITIIVSFILMIRGGNLKNKIVPIIAFVIQLALNLSWSPVFFGMQNITFALIIIILLWLSIILTMFLFYQHSKWSTYLLIPYLLWVTFATYLNLGYMILN